MSQEEVDGAALEMSAALLYMNSRAPRPQQAPYWPPLKYYPLFLPRVLLT